MTQLLTESHTDLCRVEFACLAPQARSVFLVGTFNNWDSQATRMRSLGDGQWMTVLHLQPGFYHYKFVADGRWNCTPHSSVEPYDVPGCVPNRYGSLDRVAVVG